MEIILVQLGYHLNETGCQLTLTFCQLIIGFIARLRLGTAADFKNPAEHIIFQMLQVFSRRNC